MSTEQKISCVYFYKDGKIFVIINDPKVDEKSQKELKPTA